MASFRRSELSEEARRVGLTALLCMYLMTRVRILLYPLASVHALLVQW